MLKHNSSSTLLTNSNLSLDTIEDEETEPWHGLYHKLTTVRLEALKEAFDEDKPEKPLGRFKSYEVKLRKEEFVNAIDQVFGNSKYSLQASLLFSQVDKQSTGAISWNQFLDFIIENFRPIPKTHCRLKFSHIFEPPHVKKETVVKIVLLETQKYFCYCIIAKHGRIGIYDGNMNFLTAYHAIMTKEDISRSDEERKRRNRWVTDAVFLQDLLMLVITTTARNLTIYDASGLKHTPLWLILGIHNVVQCLSYIPYDDSKLLFLGDDKGQVILMKFLRPKIGLFRKKNDDKMSVFYWTEVEKDVDHVAITNFGKLFEESVRRIEAVLDNETFVACSSDPNCSILIRPFTSCKRSYVFKVNRGATCFALNRQLKIIVSGNSEGILEVWNTVGTKKPVTIFEGHKSEVMDLQIMEQHELILSVAKDGVLKMWDIKEEKCLQTVHIKFPSFGILGKTIEWGTHTIYFSGKSFLGDPYIFVPCCNHVAKINLSYGEESESSVGQSTLPPPPIQTSVLIPSTWKIQENLSDEEEAPMQDQQRVPKKTVDNDLLSQYEEELKLILDENFFSNPKSCVNSQIAKIEQKKLEMKFLVSNCAPYLTLDLQSFKEISLSPDLPVPNNRKVKKTIEKIQSVLTDASTRDRVFSEASSEQSKGHSSISSVFSTN